MIDPPLLVAKLLQDALVNEVTVPLFLPVTWNVPPPKVSGEPEERKSVTAPEPLTELLALAKLR